MIKQKQIFILIIGCVLCMAKINCNNKTIAANREDSTTLSQNTIACNEDRQYLQSLENLNVEDIEKKIKKSEKREKLKAFTDENGNIDFKKYYKNTIFMGDSITEYISAANMLPESNVYAKIGITLLGTEEYVDRLQYSKPDRVMILFGMNDVSNFSSPEEFKQKYIELVNNIKRVTPDTKIYLQSPTPIQAKAEDAARGLSNSNLDKFRQAVVETASETGVTYVDISVLIDSDQYFDQDGIHFKQNFYDRLFEYLKNTIEKNEKE